MQSFVLLTRYGWNRVSRNFSLRLNSVKGDNIVERALLNDIVHVREDQTSPEVPNAEPSVWN